MFIVLNFWNSLYHLKKVEIHIKHTYLYEPYAYKEDMHVDMQYGVMQKKCMQKNTKSWNAKMNLK
jgi:hypothetical protein